MFQETTIRIFLFEHTVENEIVLQFLYLAMVLVLSFQSIPNGAKLQELYIMQSNNDKEIYLNIRKVSYGILNVTICLVYLKYPTFIETLGYIEGRHTRYFPSLCIKYMVIFIEKVLVYPLAFHITGKSWQEENRYMVVTFNET